MVVLGSPSLLVLTVSVDVKKVEVVVLGSPSLLVLTVSVDVKKVEVAVLGSPSLIVLTAIVARFGDGSSTRHLIVLM